MSRNMPGLQILPPPFPSRSRFEIHDLGPDRVKPLSGLEDTFNSLFRLNNYLLAIMSRSVPRLKNKKRSKMNWLILSTTVMLLFDQTRTSLTSRLFSVLKMKLTRRKALEFSDCSGFDVTIHCGDKKFFTHRLISISNLLYHSCIKHDLTPVK